MQLNMEMKEQLEGIKLFAAAKIADESFAKLKAEAELAVAKYQAAKGNADKTINEFMTYAGSIAQKYGCSQDKLDWDKGTVETPDPAPAVEAQVKAEAEAAAP
jgi:hypothetical protein